MRYHVSGSGDTAYANAYYDDGHELDLPWHIPVSDVAGSATLTAVVPVFFWDSYAGVWPDGGDDDQWEKAYFTLKIWNSDEDCDTKVSVAGSASLTTSASGIYNEAREYGMLHVSDLGVGTYVYEVEADHIYTGVSSGTDTGCFRILAADTGLCDD